jgi:hypothetical protein
MKLMLTALGIKGEAQSIVWETDGINGDSLGIGTILAPENKLDFLPTLTGRAVGVRDTIKTYNSKPGHTSAFKVISCRLILKNH